MNIQGVAPTLTATNTLLSQKSFMTLIELIKPLGSDKALVSVVGMDQITLSIKTPLEAQTLYWGRIQKEADRFLLKELFPLPQELKILLKHKAHLTLTHLIEQLSRGKSPQKVLLESLALELVHTHDKTSVKELLDQTAQLLHTQEATLIFEHEGLKGYVSFKKNKSKFSQKMLKFEAFFQTLGALQGRLNLIEPAQKSHVTIEVQTQEAASILENARKRLNMGLTISVKPDLSVTPKNTLLDIKV